MTVRSEPVSAHRQKRGKRATARPQNY